MSRRPDFFGSVRHGTQLLCGYDGGHEERDACGKAAAVHVWPGSPPDERHDHACWACDEHATLLYGRAWDWHPVGGACGIPDAIWYNGTSQGLGLCRHELDDETLTVALADQGGRALVQAIHDRKAEGECGP